MEIKANRAAAFLARPDPEVRTILLFGPDQGLVSERAVSLVARTVGTTDDPFSVVTLDADTLASDPPRLAEEAHAISLFGGKRAIRVRAYGQRSIIPALEPVLATPPTDAIVVIEAGDLRKTAPLRKLCEAARSAAAIGCYAESDLDRLIDEEMKAHDLRITDEARMALRQSIGADRLQSRGEIRKLCLYVGTGEVTLAHVRAVVADAADSNMDEIVDAAALGDPGAMTHAWRQVTAEGTLPGTIILAAQRHFQSLHRGSAILKNGGNMMDALARMQMAWAGPRRTLLEKQLRLWQPEGIERALERIGNAVAQSRLQSALAGPIISDTLLAIAAEAARRSARR